MKARYLVWACAFLLASATASAQQLASIVGTVTDPSGAAVPGVNIQVSNSAKGFAGRYVSNSAGEYTAPHIPIGDYAVVAEASGFQKLTRRDAALRVRSKSPSRLIAGWRSHRLIREGIL